MKDARAFRFEYKKLNTKFLFVDDLYQRTIDPERVKKIIDNFDPNLVNPIKVSFRDGKYWIVDGHHTERVLITRNKNEDLLVDCKVFYGMTWLDEVNMFLEQNGQYARSVNINDKLRAKMNAGDPEVSTMVKLAAKTGFIIDFKNSKGDNKIVALSTLMRAYGSLTQEEYVDYLSLIKKTWGGASDSLCREILQGTFIFYKTYKGQFKTQNFINRLKKVAPYAIIRDGRASSSPGATKYARQILGWYNRNAKDRLPDLL